MQSSARNQFKGSVSHISHGIVTDEVQIRTEDMDQMAEMGVAAPSAWA